ncbi:MAG TPA: hypothetical protein VF488_07860 [Gemmatimonadaceae bacterium]
MRSTPLVLAATSFALSTSRPADACSPPPCWGGAFVPGNHGRVPANAPALFWRPMFVYDDLTSHPMNVVLTSAADPTTPIALTAQPFGFGDFLFAPNAPLAPGEYVLTDHTDCDEFGITGPQVAFTVVPAAPMPTALGTLTAIPEGVQQIELSTSLGSCSVQTPVAAAQIALTPSDATLPWLDVLHFETWVDGKRWQYSPSSVAVVPPGASPLGRARDRVFQVCSTTDATVGTGLVAGKHVVTMRATLPGSSQVVMSSPVEVTLQCDRTAGDPPGDPPAAGGCSAGAGAGPWLGLALLALVRPVRRRERSARQRT